ncbi:transposase [Verticillium dahliae]
MATTNEEANIQLALQTMRNDKRLSARAAAKLYSVTQTTPSRRLKGMASRRDTTPKSRNLTELEESTIVQYVLELVSRSFPPRLCGVEDMANRLLADRDAPRVGKRWASNFVKRQPDLKTRFFRKHDYKRAQCEDPDAINAWFALVRTTIAKHGIAESDIYNFDETGFMISKFTL